MGVGEGGGGRLFEAGCLLTFSAFRMGAYSRWALIRGWALIRINTVRTNIFTSKISGWYRTQATQPGVTGQDGQRQERDRFKDFPKQFI